MPRAMLSLLLLPGCFLFDPTTFDGEFEGLYRTDGRTVDLNCDGSGLSAPFDAPFFKLRNEPSLQGLTYLPCPAEDECYTLDEVLDGAGEFFWTAWQSEEGVWERENMGTIFDTESSTCLAVWFTHTLEDLGEGQVKLNTLVEESYVEGADSEESCRFEAERFSGARSCLELDAVTGTWMDSP